MMSQRRTKTALVIAVIACIVVVIGAISGAEGKPGKKRRHHVSAAQIDPGLAGRYGVLQRERGARDHLPQFAVDRMGSVAIPGGEKFDIDPAQSRLASVGGGRSVYVVPGTGALCLASVPDHPTKEAGGETCSTAAQLRTGYMISTAGIFEQTGSERVQGFVPDGASVSVAVAGGPAMDAPVEGNVFSLDLPGSLRGVTVTERDGKTRTIDWSD
jgi:hypothetical protein